jgi:Ca-activated chloride channel family protein
MKKAFFLLFLLLAFGAGSEAQKKTRILFLFDASGSMYAKMQNETRIVAAKRLLSHMVDSMRTISNLEIALRVYGHQSPPSAQDCRDTKLEVAFGRNNHSEMIEKIKGITPKGTTLIAQSLQEAAYDFPKEEGVRNVIILITDGLEECKGDPCAVSEALQRQGIILKPFIIGVGVNDDFASYFDCVGRYFDAGTEGEFETILKVVISQAINETTAQVNLLDIYGRATESNVNMTFYDSRSGKIIHNFIHTMNDRGVPDTLTIDPSFTYHMQVHTIPPVYAKEVKLIPGRHNIIPVDAPQGDLSLKIEGVTAYGDLKAIVRQKDKAVTMHVQNFNTRQKYIVGKYDLEILTVPRIYLNNVSIDQSKVTDITIPQPGKLHLMGTQEYFGAVYQMKGNTMEWVMDISNTQKKQLITLQPGKYRLIYRAKKVTKTYMTVEMNFEILSGGSTHLNLF